MARAALPTYRFTANEFHRMGQAGIFASDDRIELIDGEIVPMSPIGEAHAAVVEALVSFFFRHLSDRVHLRIQNPVVLSDRTVVQPDVALLTPRGDGYRNAHPGPGDTFLVVEVSDTTLERDRLKLRLYARAGVPEVWIVDIAGSVIHVNRTPEGERYRDVTSVRRGGSLAPSAFPEARLDPAAALG